MSKQKTSLSYIYKIHSSRLRNSEWSLDLKFHDAMSNGEVISIGESTALRFIRDIEDSTFNYKTHAIKVKEIKNQIKKTKKEPTTPDSRKKIKELYSKLYELLFIKHYVCVVIDRNSDFERMNTKKGFHINGLKFKRLLATSGGAKNNTVVYVSETVYEELNRRIENDRNPNVELVPAKLEAYKSLVCSGSTPVSSPKGILVVKDCVTNFKANVIKIDDTQSDYPKVTYEKDYDITLEESDGYGLILPTLSKKWANELGEDYIPSGFCIRNSFTKGMLFSFDFCAFGKHIAKENYMVTDVWGNSVDIRNVEIILTTSMLKLWSSYRSIEHYLECCEKNKHGFSVTKVTPKRLENERNLNYQFIQSLQLDDSSIEELIKPTVDEIKDVLGGDYRKSLLFLKGIYQSESDFLQSENDFVKALMLDKKMINDPFVRNKIHTMIRKRIKEAKVGVLKTSGNFSTVSGDPFSLMQSVYGMEVTGLLGVGEFYNKYWIDKNVHKVACFRAPMTCHNNIRVLRFKNNSDTEYWYQYMNTVTIFNSWDTTAHALNGADKDGDSVMTTDNEVLLNAVEELDSIVCVQKSAKKKVVTEKDLIKANRDSFGDEIGSTTNRITSMFDVRARFAPDSEEHKELSYRIQCGQNYQQNAIDKTKGIVSKPMPKEWYDYKINIVNDTDEAEIKKKKELNLRILADKKPYFFIYIYPEQMREYKRYIENCEKNCIRLFGMSIDELINQKNKDKQQLEFIEKYNKDMPVFLHDSVMNKICRRIEKEFNNTPSTFSEVEFDYNLLKSDMRYSMSRYHKLKELYEDHNKRMQEHEKKMKSNRADKNELQRQRDLFVNEFMQKSYSICNNEEELCNILIDICYSRNRKSKQFVWDVCGHQIIENLKKKNKTYSFPIQDETGDIVFSGERFKMFSVGIEE